MPRQDKFEQVIDYKTLARKPNPWGCLDYLRSDEESGPAHAKEFEVQVSVNGKIIGQGRGRFKKAVEQEAAKKQWRIRIPHVFKRKLRFKDLSLLQIRPELSLTKGSSQWLALMDLENQTLQKVCAGP